MNRNKVLIIFCHCKPSSWLRRQTFHTAHAYLFLMLPALSKPMKTTPKIIKLLESWTFLAFKWKMYTLEIMSTFTKQLLQIQKLIEKLIGVFAAFFNFKFLLQPSETWFGRCCIHKALKSAKGIGGGGCTRRALASPPPPPPQKKKKKKKKKVNYVLFFIPFCISMFLKYSSDSMSEHLKP